MTLSFDKVFSRNRADQRYRHLVRQFDSAFFLVVPKTGKVQDVNHKAIELTGYARQTLLELSLAELIDHQTQAGSQALEALRALEPNAFRRLQNVPLCGYGGRRRLADLRISYVGVEEGEAVVLILAHDAKNRTRSEQQDGERKQSLGALEALATLLTAPETAAMAAAAKISRTLLLAKAVGIYHVNVLPVRELSLQAGAALPPGFPQALPADETAALRHPQVWRAGEPADTLLTRAAHAAGWTAMHTQPLGSESGMFGVLVAGYHQHVPTDVAMLLRLNAQMLAGLITTQLNVQQAHNNQSHAEALIVQFHTILEQLDEAIIVADNSGNVVTVNRAAEALLGYSAIEAANIPLSEVLVTPQPVVDYLLTTTQAGDRYDKQDLTLIRRDGESLAVWLWAFPLPAPPSSLAIVIVDRTEHHDLLVQSTHLQQRAFLGDLSAIFAHEVRNPLNGISTGLQYLATLSLPDDPLQESLAEIQAEADRIEHLLRDILVVAKPAERNAKPHDLGKLIQRILMRWQPRMARYDIQSEYDVAPNISPVLIDLRQIDQVFTNLITNATDAMSEAGGKLTIHVKPAMTARGKFVKVTVADTGPGIPEEKLDQVFKPFFTTKTHGNGLGLAISQHFINNNKGTIMARSWPGVGTVFEVLLPAAAGRWRDGEMERRGDGGTGRRSDGGMERRRDGETEGWRDGETE